MAAATAARVEATKEKKEKTAAQHCTTAAATVRISKAISLEPSHL